MKRNKNRIKRTSRFGIWEMKTLPTDKLSLWWQLQNRYLLTMYQNVFPFSFIMTYRQQHNVRKFSSLLVFLWYFQNSLRSSDEIRPLHPIGSCYINFICSADLRFCACFCDLSIQTASVSRKVDKLSWAASNGSNMAHTFHRICLWWRIVCSCIKTFSSNLSGLFNEFVSQFCVRRLLRELNYRSDDLETCISYRTCRT